jgi:MYXO-CTERM domain-containing protein
MLMRSNQLLGGLGAAALALCAADASAQTVLVWSTGGNTANAQAVAAWIQASNQFTSVTGLDQTTVPLSTLVGYDRLLFFTNGSTGSDPNNGNVLSSYAATGRRLVLATFSWADQGGNTLGGAIITNQESPFVLQGGSLYTNVTMASNDSSAMFSGVTSLSGYYHDNVTLTPGAVQRGTWSDGEPLVAQKNNIVAVNLFPDDSYGSIGGDYMQLFVNALDASVCGDGIVDAGEQCDAMGESASCDDDCTFPVCGDGVLNMSAGEACDDNNTLSGDGCSATCSIETSSSVASSSATTGSTTSSSATTGSASTGSATGSGGSTGPGSGAGGASSGSGGAPGSGGGLTSGGFFDDDDDSSKRVEGCGCRVAGEPASDEGAWALALLALGATLRRRRRDG